MDWLNQIGGLLQRYVGADANQAPASAPADFDRLAQAVPQQALAQGIAHAFRSDQTPPFQQMVGQLFGNSEPHQRAGLLESLVGAIGPSVASQALGALGIPGLGGRMSPQQAAQVPPEAVQQLAGMAEQHNPSVIDQVSGYVAQHPGLFQSLGAGALTAALSGLGQQHFQGGYGAPAGYAPASQDPYGDPADQYANAGFLGGFAPASQDPYGDPADQQFTPASQDPYGDPADMAVSPASEDPYGDPADQQPAGRW